MGMSMRVEKASLQQVKDRFAAHKRKAPGKDEPYGKMKTSRAMKKCISSSGLKNFPVSFQQSLLMSCCEYLFRCVPNLHNLQDFKARVLQIEAAEEAEKYEKIERKKRKVRKILIQEFIIQL